MFPIVNRKKTLKFVMLLTSKKVLKNNCNMQTIHCNKPYICFTHCCG
jgi:hypothetical protein